MSETKIRVKTSDGVEVEVDLEIAKQWAPIKNLYEVLGTIDTKDKPIELEDVKEATLKKIIEWINHHKQDLLKAETQTSENANNRSLELTQWDNDYFKIEQQLLFEIMLASNYLGVIELLDQACKTVANMIKDKTPEQVRQHFNIPNDLPPFPEPDEIPAAATATS